MAEAFIVDAARTPRGIGKPGRGSLTEIHPQRLLGTVFRSCHPIRRGKLRQGGEGRRRHLCQILCALVRGVCCHPLLNADG